jgi:hypothetical protein
MLEWIGADGLSGLLYAAKDLGDGNPALRGNAAFALGNMSSAAEKKIPALTKALTDAAIALYPNYTGNLY